jgi:hypothetical protein
MRKALVMVLGSILITLLLACKASDTPKGTASDQQAAQNPPVTQASIQNTSQQSPDQPSTDQGSQNTAPSGQAPTQSYPAQSQQNYTQNAGYSGQESGGNSYPQAARYSTGQIEQMVAPIALYPDALMTQVLMAAAYPYDVADADQWLQSNRGLSGSNLDNALATASWDPSVIALCKFPSALDRMGRDIQWTTDLGTAFLNQRPEVMSAIQRLRQDAYRNGHLRTSSQQRVVMDTQYIEIQPYTPNVYYVPYYNPQIVYGSAWNYPNYYYPNVWTPSPYYSPGYSFVNGFAWGIGMSFGNVLFGGYDWNHQNAYINNNVFYGNNIYRNTDYYHNRGMYGGQAQGTWAYNARYNQRNEGFVRAPYAGQNRGEVRGMPAGAVRGGTHGSAAVAGNHPAQLPGRGMNQGQVQAQGMGAGQSQHPGGPGHGQGQGLGAGQGQHPGGQGSNGQGQGMGPGHNQGQGQGKGEGQHQGGQGSKGQGKAQGMNQGQGQHQGGQGQGKAQGMQGQGQHQGGQGQGKAQGMQGQGQRQGGQGQHQGGQGQGGGKNKQQGAGQGGKNHPSGQPENKAGKN